MPFTPRLSQEIHEELLGMIVARSELTDAEASSVINAIVSSFADEMAKTEFSIQKLKESFDLNTVSSYYLDDRVAQLPPTGLTRLPASAASSAALQLTRADNTAEQTVPRGATFSRSDNSNVVYVLNEDVTMAIGVTTYPDDAVGNPPNPRVSCTQTGTIGNCAPGLLTRILSGPEFLTACDNSLAITGGIDIESDSSLRKRAFLYLGSLARCQRSALLFKALSFISSTGIRVRHAGVFEDENTPGVVHLVVDDGEGMVGFEEVAPATTGIIPENASPILVHASPATGPVTAIEVSTIPTADPVVYDKMYTVASPNFTDTSSGWVSIPERGTVIIKEILDKDLLKAGYGWRIGNPDKAITKMNIYTDAISELQTLIEGKVTDPTNVPGFRAAGIRVIVVPPEIDYPAFRVDFLAETGTDLVEMSAAIKFAIVSFCKELGPGEFLYLGELTKFLMDTLSKLVSVIIKKPSDDIAPTTLRHVIRAKADLIEVI
jgi:hypothetical protein